MSSFLCKPLLLTERTGALVTLTLQPHSFSVPPDMSLVPAQTFSKEKKSKDQTSLDSLSAVSWILALSKHPKTSHQGSRWMFPFPTDGNLQYLSAVFYSSCWCLAEVQLAPMPPPMVLVHPHLFPGHYICSVIALLQAEKEPSLLLPKVTMLSIWFLLISSFFPIVQSLLTSCHSSFSSVSSLAPVRLWSTC